MTISAIPGRAVPACFVALILLLASSPAHADEWLGKDKFYHFSASVAVGSGAFLGSAYLYDEGTPAAWSAMSMGTVVTVGVGKELYDLGMGKEFSGKDLAWDVAGGLTAVGLNLLIWSLAAD